LGVEDKALIKYNDNMLTYSIKIEPVDGRQKSPPLDELPSALLILDLIHNGVAELYHASVAKNYDNIIFSIYANQHWHA
jgi:hypothetical protein